MRRRKKEKNPDKDQFQAQTQLKPSGANSKQLQNKKKSLEQSELKKIEENNDEES